ncbi:hypothetical protein A1A1_07107 [Planococcus antarcticus DSM 14505]|uniref:Transposase n=1 Tax=Planococcus antarcticus DSM 14505 TaxID=1185653 RepID=A0A1C7DFB3_9BACL|nr:hypothetical protein [Planococcus antarcticus]ANU10239.1 hypothetical protein BBH88_07965 [Planococcus antarcticus DSM 14505]EIM07146.1 hypothetical protein A1A1_07107 [Planococcus antarcticus DSM 14505]
MAQLREIKNEFEHIPELQSFEETHQIDKIVKTTSLYTIKLISRKDTSDFCREVLLLEHAPAKEMQAYLWVHKVNANDTQIEVMRKINKALERRFDNKGRKHL